jgi:hypothetical protein
MRDIDHLPRMAVQVTRAARLFDGVASALLPQQPRPGATIPGYGCESVERSQLRERLDQFFPEYRQLYFDMLQRRLGSSLPAVLAALNNELIQSYFRALESMERELIHELQQLAQRMASSIQMAPIRSNATTSHEAPEVPKLSILASSTGS